MTGLDLRGKGLGEAARALAGNRQFVAGLAVVLVAVLFAPGTPAPSLLSADSGQVPAQVSQAPQPAPPAPPPPGAQTAGVAGPDVESPDETVIPRDLPPAPAPPPPLVCDTDALADVLDSVREPLGELLGTHIPGAALRDLAAIATGCSDKEPSGPLVELALEVGALVPDLGLDPIPLPNLRPLLPDIRELLPDAVRQLIGPALAPLADPIREGCAQLPLITLVVTLTPVITGLPLSSSDLVQFLDPVSSLCGLFDEELEDIEDDDPIELPGSGQ